MAAAFILGGYVLLVVEFGWPGALAAFAHALVMLVGTWRR